MFSTPELIVTACLIVLGVREKSKTLATKDLEDVQATMSDPVNHYGKSSCVVTRGCAMSYKAYCDNAKTTN